jgi:hypothetical protein
VIVDTNALSAFDADAAVVRHFEQADDIAVPVIVLGEYRFGLLGSRKRHLREGCSSSSCGRRGCSKSRTRPPGITRQSGTT